MESWKVVETFVQQFGLVRHQIESYDNFILNIIPAIISENESLRIEAPTSSAVELKKQTYPFSNPLSIVIPVGPSIPEVKRHTFTFSNPLVTPPTLTEYDGTIVTMTPQMARLRNLSYQVSVFIQVQHDTYRESTNELVSSECERILLCQIPLMLKSQLCVLRNKSQDELFALGECINDDGGYFIIKGGERAIVAQEKRVLNFIYVSSSKVQRALAEAQIFSVAEGYHRSSSQLTMYWINISKKSNLPTYVVHVKVQDLPKKEIPLAILFKAIGVVDPKDILARCGVDADVLRSTLEEGWMADSQDSALDWIARKNGIGGATPEVRREDVMSILVRHLFPHVGGARADKLPEKGWFLGLMANHLILTVQGKREFDDRDHFGNKRVDATGTLIGSLFKQSLHKMFNEFIIAAIRKLSHNKVLNFHTEINHTYITGPISYSFSTGNWSINKQKSIHTGVSQVLMRLSQVAMISHLRKFITNTGKEGKLTKPRQLHSSSWMRADPNETPEGEGCGLHKSLTLLAHISIQTHANITPLVLTILSQDYKVDMLPFSHQTVKLIINGAWVANVEDGLYVAGLIRQIRREQIIPFDVGIVYRYIDREICVSTDGGRLCRPVFIVKDHQLVIPSDVIDTLKKQTYPVHWLLRQGYVEYIDATEEEELMIAVQPSDLEKYPDHYTHCEIDPSLIMGIAPGLIPFSDHNPSPRVTYSAQFYKQAMGTYATNYLQRMDTSAHVLVYPQKPVVSTKTADLINFDKYPAGQMAVVALGCYGGWNCEDSIIVNQTSIDRGLFRSITYKTYQAEEKKMTGNITEDFCIPDRAETMGYNRHHGGYHAIDCQDGLPIPGSKVGGGDVIVAKTHTMPTIYDSQGMSKSMLTGLPGPTGKMTKRDVSITLGKIDKGIIDKVMVSNNDEVKNTMQDQSNSVRTFIRQRFTKVRIRSMRVPEIGDKIALTSPQKGTIGLLVREEDMPYTKDGIVPDVLLNPSCLPSRMTTSQVLETLFGKTAMLQGKSHVDGSVFTTNTDKAEEMSEQLKQLGFEPYGNEILYHGSTGEMIPSKIFIGVNFYQRLKHMVNDKIHCLTGDHEVLTEQGWKTIPTITLEDKVAILRDGELIYETPLEVLSFDYKGKMYHISNQAIDLDVTLNHRMYVSVKDCDKWSDYSLLPVSDILEKEVKYKSLDAEIDVTNASSSIYDYDGKVYCLSVSSEIFMVRRNGKSVWTGNSRATGKVTTLFRSPTEGRSREGGLRTGEMEASALAAHGVASFLRERLFYLSDYYSTFFCARCNFFAVANFKKHSFKCGNCGHDKLNRIELPYACKLLFQELMAMGIVPRVGKYLPNA